MTMQRGKTPCNPHPFTNSIMRKTSLLVAAATILTAGSAAAGTIVVSFGLTSNSTTPAGVTRYNLATSTSGGQIDVANLNDVTGAATGIALSDNTTSSFFSAGTGGSFAPVGSVAYTNADALVNSWKSTYETAYGTIWQGLMNPSGTGGQTSKLTFSNLAANTTYEFTLLSARANDYGTTSTGTYRLSYGTDADAVTTTLLGAGTLDEATDTVTGVIQGSSAGLNAREIRWSFTTGETAESASLDLAGMWNVNALVINATAVPEPSTYGLLGAGALAAAAFVRRRRRTR